MFSGITTILFSSFWQYPPYFVANSFNISAKYPPNFRQYPPYFADNLFITITNFPYFLFITMTKFTQICALDWPYSRYFIHYVDKFSPKSRKYIHLWNLIPQYLQICGVLGIDVTYAHDNRELSDCVVKNNQKRLIFADITEKWYTWRVFTGMIGNCKEFITFYFHFLALFW